MLQIIKHADTSSGRRVSKIVQVDELEDGSPVYEKRLVNPDTPGDDHEPWPLDRVELVGDAPKDHNFADSFVARASQDGYLEFTKPRVVSTEVDGKAYERNPVVTGDEIVLHLASGDLRYKVVEHPGRYREDDGTHRVTHEYVTRLVRSGKAAS
jgi:hypothetical protein